jgi:hypothetical protein
METTPEKNPASQAAEQFFAQDLGIKGTVNVQEPVKNEPVVPPVTEPVVTPPVTEPVVNPEILLEEDHTPAPAAFDETKYLTETFGTADKTVIKDRIEKFEATKKELEEAALLLSQPKYKNKAAEVFDDILSKVGGDTKTQSEFIKNTLDLLNTDETQLSPVDLVKFHLKSNYSGLTPAQLDAHIAQTYMQGEEFTQEQKDAGMVRLSQDAVAAKTALSEMKAKVLTTDNSKQAALHQLQEEKRKTEWVAPVQKVVEDFKTIKLNVGKIGGKNASINFEVPADVAKRYEGMVYNSMLSTGGLPNDQSIAIANRTLRALYIADNLDHITAHVFSKATSEGIKKEVETYHNPNVTGNGQQRTEVGAKKSQDELYAESMGWKK